MLAITLIAFRYTRIVTNPRSPQKKSNTRSTGRATLADVAHLAGVTTMTVSRYLREPHRVAPATAEKIQSALVATAYTPNKQAGMLASGKSPVIAAIIPSVGNTIFAETVQGLCDVFQGAGFELLLAATNYNMAREEELVRAVLGWTPAALVMVGRRHTPGTLQMMRAAAQGNTPVFEIWDKDAKPSEFVQIGFNHEAVGALMAGHLMDCGYRRLAYVDSGVREDFRAHERGLGFVKEAQKRGCTVTTRVAPQCEPMLAGRAALRELVEHGLPEAAAFANDHLAAGAFLEAQALKIEMPGTLGILGFGDFPLTTQLGGGISTVITHRYAIGRATALRVLHALSVKVNLPEDQDASGSLLDQAQALALEPIVVRRSTT